tara:strand:- start:1500 stop:1694 length:195 start_codon:yes stop_codon:yes gene_type:complete
MRDHGMVWGIALLLALLLGWLDYETTSWKVLLCNKGNLVALLIYTLLIAGIGYLIRWVFKNRIT